MLLKTYQQNTLDVLQRFFEKSRMVGHKEAFKIITSEPDIQHRLGLLKTEYIIWDKLPNTPRLCLKVPTGGGKTILACHSIRIISDTWIEKDYPVVLWFVPSDTIRKQTVEALKNPRHPYRQALDEQFKNYVKVFDIDEKFNIRPQDISNNLCLIVTTIQSFNKKDTDKYNVYKHNENLEPHFTQISSTEEMETIEGSKEIKYSFANLLHYHRPIMIVDEAHNAVTSLSEETQSRINPSAIVEFTATPRPNNNTLYNVKALELKEEEMIKLPIVLTEHNNWEIAVAQAIEKRAELEKASEKDEEYIRPIVLFQAQDKDQEFTVEYLKKHLIETLSIPEEQIAIATGEQKELDGINIFDKKCPIHFIITVEALKEGWDCSFAYILCSLANVRSNTAVEQLLGRVMRMPYARKRKISALNKAYAYIISSNFGEAAASLVDKLIDKGFENDEATAVIEQQFDSHTLFTNWDPNKITIETKLKKNDLPQNIELHQDSTGKQSIVLTQHTTEKDIEHICTKLTEGEAYQVKQQYKNRMAKKSEKSFASTGAKFNVPALMLELQGKLEFPDPDIIFEYHEWNLLKHSPKLELHEFKLEKQGNGFIIDIDGKGLTHSVAGADQIYLPNIDVAEWTETTLVTWLDKYLKQIDIPQTIMLKWLSDAVNYLVKDREIHLSALMVTKYVLARKLQDKINVAREIERNNAYQQAFFSPTSRLEINLDKVFSFSENMYDDQPLYKGTYKFTKHFLGSDKVPMFDGAEHGEEFQCAQAIDSLDEVKYWIRNVAKGPGSFWLPTSKYKFYPDFIAELKDGRILVVEYKGAFLMTADETKEKQRIGELWEKHSKGKCLFLMAELNRSGLNTREQIIEKISK